jgi:hypothetical protein
MPRLINKPPRYSRHKSGQSRVKYNGKTTCPVPDVVRAIVRQARPDDETGDQDHIKRLKAQMGARVNQAQYMTHRGNFDQTRFILETTNELKEIDRLICKWSGADRAAPGEIHAKVLEKCREVDAWNSDGLLLAQHASLVRTTDPDEARDHIQHLAEEARRGGVPCGRTERPSDGLFRFMTEAVKEFQAVQGLAQALGTDETRAAAVQAAISTAGREKVTQEISRAIPCVNRSHAIESQLLRLEAEQRDTHPRTTQYDELGQKIDTA